DFDRNGTIEQIISVPNTRGTYPLVLRHDLVKQIPSLKKKYLKYESYKEQSVTDIFDEAQLENAVIWQAEELRSTIFINEGNMRFTMKALPKEVQFAPVKSILIEDIDNDGNKDLVIGGNFSKAKPETGIYAASYGNFLKGDGKGNFDVVPARESGLICKGEVRDFVLLEINGKKRLYVLKNNEALQVYDINNQNL
ncbi:MAG: hypothetical protein AAGI07_04555, partial [Bacteroidota bacterium]